MALVNLFKVTKTLTDLLARNITRHIDPSLDGLLTVTAIPPDKVQNPSNTLSFYLYHLAEDPHYRNAAGPGRDAPNVAKAPMGLILFYILTAHHETDSTFDAEAQQKLMGYALKTFHDIPVVTDRTRVDGTLILDPDLRGRDNTLQVILRPVPPEDAVAFWNSEDQRTARLSAYYEVRVVMLEPEKPAVMPGIVLNLGMFLVQMGAPHLDRSRNVVRFRIPEKNGGTVQQVEASPARVTLDASATPPEAHNRIELLGTNLTIGRSRSLFLANNLWASLPPPGGPVAQAVVDPGLNPGWNVEFQTDRILLALAPALKHEQPDGTTIDLPVLPGSYNAFVRAVKDEAVVGGELKRVAVSSNVVGFAVTPRILGHEAPDGSGNIQVNLGPEFDPLDANLPDDPIEVIVAGEVYTRAAGDPPQARQFFATNTPSNLIRIGPHFPVGATAPEAYPFRLIVNGAEAAPFWIEVGP